MSDTKISQLPVVTTLAGSDVIPVVASGVTSQITSTNLATVFADVDNYTTTSSFNSFTSSVLLNTFSASGNFTGGLKVTGSLSIAPGNFIYSNPTGSVAQVFSMGGYTSDMSNLSGSSGFRYIPAGYQNYFLNSNESFNSKTSYFLYNLTSNGTSPSNPFYSSTITIVNRAGGNTAWVIPSPADSSTNINNLGGAFTSQSIAPGSYITLLVDYESLFPQWIVLSSGSLATVGGAIFSGLSVNGSLVVTGSVSLTGSLALGGKMTLTGSLWMSSTSSFAFPLTASIGIPTGSAYWSGSWLWIYDGTRYRSASFA